MLRFHPDCGWDAAQIAATPTRREVFAAPPQMAAAIAQQGQVTLTLTLTLPLTLTLTLALALAQALALTRK